MKNPSLYPPDWLKIAKKDWHRIKTMLNDGDPDAAGYFLQQALEKFLKAFLLDHGWELKKIHPLFTLLDDAVKYNPKLEVFRDLCEIISGYYIADRYPYLVVSELTTEDIEKDLAEAERLINALGFTSI